MESAVKHVKHAIAHSDGTAIGIKTACHNLNWEQRVDKSCFPAELFLHALPASQGWSPFPINSLIPQMKGEEGQEAGINRLSR